MPLRRLTALAKLELEEEAATCATTSPVQRLLKSETRRRTLVLKELGELVEKHGQDRKAEIVKADDIPVFEAPQERDASFDPDDDEPCVVTLSTSGNLGRVAATGAKGCGRASRPRGVDGGDLYWSAMAVITSEGRAFVVHAGEAADASSRTRGNAATQQLGLNKSEAPLAGDRKREPCPGHGEGVVKQVTAEEVLGTKPGRRSSVSRRVTASSPHSGLPSAWT